jgi:hypothetical protein
MSISIEQHFSVSVPLILTDGPFAALDETSALALPPTSSNPGSVRVVYPDPTPGVANPNRSVRLDALGGAGGTIAYGGDGHNGTLQVTVQLPVNRGSATFGEPSEPFPTPAA